MPRLRTLLLLIGDTAILVSSYLVAFFLLRELNVIPYSEFFDFLLIEEGLLRIFTVVAPLVACIYWFGLYESLRIRSRRILFENLLLIWGLVFLLQALLSYTKRDIILSRWIMTYGSALAIVSMIGWRSVFSLFLVRLVGRQRILFLGDTALNRELATHIEEHPEKGFQSLGCISIEDTPITAPFPGNTTFSLRANTDLNAFMASVLTLKPDRIIVAGQLPSQKFVFQSLLQLSIHSIRIESAGDLYEILFQQVSLEAVTTNQLIFSSAFRPSHSRLLVQTSYCWLIAFVGVVFTWPLMILTAIAVKLDSEGPALLRQRRVGKNGKVFEILKFRSMYVDADKRFGRTRASENDPRITRVGKVIRQWRLDELPQFFNVLNGSMNIVGPRPEMPEYVEELSNALPLYPQRLRIKPGITGWAQLHHETEFTTSDTARKIQYDLYYIKNLSPALDFIIMFHTIRTIVMRIGAR